MTEDLERTLDELGSGYRELVGRLRATCGDCPRVRPGASLCEEPGRRRAGWLPALGALAAALALATVGFFLRDPRPAVPSPARPLSDYALAYAADAQGLAALRATQRADGSWATDYLTRQNAAALRSLPDAASRLAYRKAVRYLRAKGLEPMSERELRAGAERARRIRG